MTRTKLSFAAATLIVACMIVSLSVYGLAEGQEPDDNHQNPQTGVTALDDIDVEEIHRQVEGVLDAVPWAKLADVRGILDGVDAEGIRAEIEAAMEVLDMEEIHAEVREALEGVDWAEIQQDVEDAKSEIETIDLEGIRGDVREALEDVDWGEIRRSLEEAKGVAADELQALDELLEELGVAGSGVI